MRFTKTAGLLVAGLSAAIFASPMISVDTAEFDLGTIREGSMDAAIHKFRIKNTGDSVLTIKDARPG